MTRLLADRSILVVEDEMLVLLNIETALEELGCAAITVAADVQQALSLISSGDFDAAVVDINLAGEKSYTVADALKQRGIPFTFSTGCGGFGARTDLEASPVLRKPYTFATFEAMLKHLLAAGSPASA